MHKMNDKEKTFSTAMTTLKAYYPRKWAAEEWELIYKVWRKSLGDVPIQVLVKAFDRSIKQSPEFMPTLAIVKQHVDDISKTTLVPVERRLEEENPSTPEHAKEQIKKIQEIINAVVKKTEMK
jgi:NADH:ubiquinone oxidoreductase subunit D